MHSNSEYSFGLVCILSAGEPNAAVLLNKKNKNKVEKK